MPQVVKTQPTGAFTQGGAGIGAVIFDKPQYDTQTIALKVSDDLDNWAKQKQAEVEKKKAESAKLVADLNFDAKGAFPDDTDYFKKGSEDLINMTAVVSGVNPNSPNYQQELKKAQLQKNWMELDVNESAKQWEQFKQIDNQFNQSPDKYDADAYNTWKAKVRMARSPRDRRELFKESPLNAPKDNLEQLTLEQLKKAKEAGVLSPILSGKSYGKTPSGEDILIEQTELLPEDKRLNFASDWVSNNPNINSEVLGKFTKLSPTDIQFYTDEAAKKSNQYNRLYKPYDIWYSGVLEKYDTPSEKTTQLGYSPERQQQAQWEWGEGKKLKMKGAGLLEQLSGAFQGKPEYLEPSKSHLGYDVVKIKGLNGYKLSDYTQIVDEKPQSFPNTILEAIRTPDGRVMVMTSKSLYDEQARVKDEGGNATVQTKNLYIPYSNVTQLFNDIATGHFGKDGGEEIKVGAQEYAKPLKGYNDATAFDATKIVPLSKEDEQKRDAIYGKKTVDVPITKETGQFPSSKKTATQTPKAEEKKAEEKRIKVKRKSDGRTGTILEKDFDATKYDKI